MSMVKFVLLMLVCSGIPGNQCKPIPTPITEFNTYHECIYFGYDYSSILLKAVSYTHLTLPTILRV